MNYYDFLTTSNIGSFTFVTQKADLSKIDRVEFYPPATKLILKDGTSYVSVAQDGDVFDKVSGVEQCLLVSAKYCYATHKLRLHQNDRCKRFTLF